MCFISFQGFSIGDVTATNTYDNYVRIASAQKRVW